MKALLALEDGACFEGESFGATAVTAVGEACFNTSMTGYQEVLTDPSYRGQIVSMTYPLIGNYGINPDDNESDQPHVRGFVIEELCETPSNWRSTETLAAYLERHNIPGIQGIDTRTLTKRLREQGAMRAVISTDPNLTVEEAIRMAKESPSMEGADFVKEVSAPKNYRWDPDDQLSRQWTIPNACKETPGQTVDENGQHFQPLPEAKYHIVAYDLGIKRNILRKLRQSGFTVDVVNANTSAEDVLALNPDGIFLSNGPGDPASLDYVHTEIKKLIGKKPIFAICLGHQVLCHAFGGNTFKLKFGHRGANQPVKDLRSEKIVITSQNHGLAVAADSLPEDVEVTHINLNDGTVEGLRHRKHPVFSVQYHPEASPGPHDAEYFFEEFANLIDSSR